MSKGIGKLQRHILDRLKLGGDEFIPDWMGDRGYVGSYELARSIRDEEPTRSERVAVQRALRNLEARGLVQMMRGKEELRVRLPVSEEQRLAEQRRALQKLKATELRPRDWVEGEQEFYEHEADKSYKEAVPDATTSDRNDHRAPKREWRDQPVSPLCRERPEAVSVPSRGHTEGG